MWNLRFPAEAIVADLFLLQAWIPSLQMELNAPAWFMSALVACLFAYPAIHAVARRGFRVLAIISMLVWGFTQVTVSTHAIMDLNPAPGYWMYLPICHLGSFMLGVVAHELVGVIGTLRNEYVCVIGAAATVLTILSTMWVTSGLDYHFGSASNIGLLAPVFAVLVYSVSQFPPVVLKHFDKTWIRLAGELSFPIYLLQVPLFKVFDSIILKKGQVTMDTPLFAGFLIFLAGGSWVIMIGTKWVTGLLVDFSMKFTPDRR